MIDRKSITLVLAGFGQNLSAIEVRTSTRNTTSCSNRQSQWVMPVSNVIIFSCVFVLLICSYFEFEAGDIAPWGVIGDKSYVAVSTDHSSCFERNKLALKMEMLCDNCPGVGVGI